MPLQHPEQIERMDVGHRPGAGGEPLVAARHFEEAVIEVLYFLGDDLLEGGAVRVLERRIGEYRVSAAALRFASGRRHSTMVSRRMASRNARFSICGPMSANDRT